MEQTSNAQPTRFCDTGRQTGLFYLLMALSGLLGFLIFHPMVFVFGDPEATYKQLIYEGGAAPVRLVLEMLIVFFQALTAIWFYRLFRSVNEWASLAVMIWGTVNSVAIMVSAMAISSAIGLAHSEVISDENAIQAVALMQEISSQAWTAGSVFFGLWLIPLGLLVIQSGVMSRILGRILQWGGALYVIQTFMIYFGVNGDWIEVLVLPATVGEFWVIGWLLWKGNSKIGVK
jgi:hypothetical protein